MSWYKRPILFAKKYQFTVVNCTQDGRPGLVPTLRWVRIHKYRINEAGSGHACDLGEKDQLLQKVRQGMRKEKSSAAEGPIRSAIARAFFAKGSPEDYATTLRCAALYAGVAPDDLQKYADDHLGLDCSGFVNQFWSWTGRLAGYSNFKTISQYGSTDRRRALLRPRETVSADPQAVQSLDMLVWTDFGHIALIDFLVHTKNGVYAFVAESTASVQVGPGITWSRYELLSVDSQKRFTVLRGGHKTRVYIASFAPVGS